MDADDARLSRIDTLWSVVRRAHAAPGDDRQAAQQLLLERYGGAILRYLRGSLRDAEAAEDAFQEFSLRFVRGDFSSARPERGRFRSFVKTSLFHLIVDYQRRTKRHAKERAVLGEIPEPEDRRENRAEQDAAFTRSWREELLARAWEGLQALEHRTGKPHYTVLRARVDEPHLRSPELAERLGPRLGKSIQPGAVRVMIHRARESFADLLLEAVADSLEQPEREELEDELVELNLLEYCRPALERQ